MAATLRLLWTVLLGAVVAAGGCDYAMPMPPEALRIVPFPEGADGREFLHEVRLLSIPGEVTYGRAVGSADSKIIAAHLSIRHRPTPMSTATGRSAVAIWSLETGELIRLLDEGSPSVDYSGSGLLDLTPDGRRVAIQDRAGMSVRDVQSGAVIRYIEDTDERSTRGSRFDADGRRVLVWDFSTPPQWMGDSYRHGRLTWIDLETGEETDAGANISAIAECGDRVVPVFGELIVENRVTSDRLSLDFPKTRAGSREGVVMSDSCRWVATEFRMRPHFLSFSVDMTPSHIRIWDTLTGQLRAWYVREEPHPRPDGSYEQPVTFVGNGDMLLVDTTIFRRSGERGDDIEFEHSFRLLDVVSLREIGRQTRPRGAMGTVSPLAGGQLIAVATWDGLSILRLAPPGLHDSGAGENQAAPGGAEFAE